jgi:hypothetical protein
MAVVRLGAVLLLLAVATPVVASPAGAAEPDTTTSREAGAGPGGPPGRLVALVSTNGYVLDKLEWFHVYDAHTGRLEREIEISREPWDQGFTDTRFVLSPAGDVAYVYRGTTSFVREGLIAYSLATGQRLWTQANELPAAAALSPRGDVLYTLGDNRGGGVGHNGVLSARDARTGALLAMASGESLISPEIAISPDGSRLAVPGARDRGFPSQSSFVRLFDARTLRLIDEIPLVPPGGGCRATPENVSSYTKWDHSVPANAAFLSDADLIVWDAYCRTLHRVDVATARRVDGLVVEHRNGSGLTRKALAVSPDGGTAIARWTGYVGLGGEAPWRGVAIFDLRAWAWRFLPFDDWQIPSTTSAVAFAGPRHVYFVRQPREYMAAPTLVRFDLEHGSGEPIVTLPRAETRLGDKGWPIPQEKLVRDLAFVPRSPGTGQPSAPTRTATPSAVASTPSPTPTPARTSTPTRSPTPRHTATSTPTRTHTPTRTPASSQDRATTRTATTTRTSTATRTLTRTATATAIATRTYTPTRAVAAGRPGWQPKTLVADVAPGESVTLSPQVVVARPVDRPRARVSGRAGIAQADPASLPSRLEPGVPATLRLRVALPPGRAGLLRQTAAVHLLDGAGRIVATLPVQVRPRR